MSTTREKDRDAGYAKGLRGMSDGLECFAEGCAHRDKQVIAYLREALEVLSSENTKRVMRVIIDQIERGEHVK